MLLFSYGEKKRCSTKILCVLKLFSNDRIGYMELYGNLVMTAYPNSLVRP